MTIENIISLSSLIVTLILVIINQVNNRKIRTEQDIVNKTLLEQWKKEKETTDKEQWDEIIKISETLSQVDFTNKQEFSLLKERSMKLELRTEAHDLIIAEIRVALKEIPTQITKEINSLKELVESKLENVKPKTRVAK